MNDQHTTSADSFISHLVELRRRVIRALLAVALVFLGLVGWAADIFRWLARPLLMNLPKDGKMIVTDVTGSFFVPVKVTLLLVLVIALPFVLYQLWAFVVPVAVVLLVHTGALTVEKLKKSRPYAVVGAFIVAAIVTPPDVISQLML